MRTALSGGPILLLLSVTAPLAAQPPAEDVVDPFTQAIESIAVDSLPPGFGQDALVAAAWQALDADRFIRARELAQRVVENDPDSVAGHTILGFVQHRSEGNLPIALYHLKKAKEVFEERFGLVQSDEAPWRWHAIAVGELAFVSGEMGRHEDKITYLKERDELYSPPWPADRGWPLMRLRRYAEARQAVEDAFELGDPGQIASARTALCAIEAEQQLREEGYEACMDAARYDRAMGQGGGPTPYTNAAEAALGMLRIDEAEKLMLEATEKFASGTVSNPWLDLMHLYLAEGRTPEALDALRRMLKWRKRQPAYMDEQNRAETEMASAIFLIVAGHPADAVRITARALDRPDRTGFTSSEAEQMEAAAALVDRLAQRTNAELLAEEASWSSLRDSWKVRLASLRARLRAWSSGRRAASLLVDERILLATLRPYLAGSVEIPEWIEVELTALLGPGIVAAAIDKARARETLSEAEGYFLAYDTEIAYLQGRRRDAVRLADAALSTLPPHEVQLRDRVAALAAQAALDVGMNQRSIELFDTAFQGDPGIIRRLGLSIPTTFAPASGRLAETASKLLRRSPRFHRASGGYQVVVDGQDASGSACLYDAQRTRLSCAEVKARAGEDSEDLARRLVAEFHAATFAPRLDLTQAEIRSLDGSPTAGGGRASDRLRNVLSELTAGG